MRTFIAGVLAIALSVSACDKKPEPAAQPVTGAEAPAPVVAPMAGLPSAAPADYSVLPEDETARKQALLDYAMMEDAFINDPKAQWAATAKASSAFGDAGMTAGDNPTSSNSPSQATGAPNDESWTGKSASIGMDWLQVAFSAPVNATEVRFVLPDGNHAVAISRIELIDDTGTAHTIFSGVSPFTEDARGPRTWVTQRFEATPYKVVGTKLTFANVIVEEFKEIDAVQIVGE
jgi:hypothetical protein